VSEDHCPVNVPLTGLWMVDKIRPDLADVRAFIDAHPDRSVNRDNVSVAWPTSAGLRDFAQTNATQPTPVGAGSELTRARAFQLRVDPCRSTRTLGDQLGRPLATSMGLIGRTLQSNRFPIRPGIPAFRALKYIHGMLHE
jgi:hypothetical protein